MGRRKREDLESQVGETLGMHKVMNSKTNVRYYTTIYQLLIKRLKFLRVNHQTVKSVSIIRVVPVKVTSVSTLLHVCYVTEFDHV